jgi:hypothetical protein
MLLKITSNNVNFLNFEKNDKYSKIGKIIPKNPKKKDPTNEMNLIKEGIIQAMRMQRKVMEILITNLKTEI